MSLETNSLKCNEETIGIVYILLLPQLCVPVTPSEIITSRIDRAVHTNLDSPWVFKKCHTFLAASLQLTKSISIINIFGYNLNN